MARQQRGFTLVELLVVIAIIGALVALLLPAVQAAREAARRMSCSNNLHQLGIAIHNYEDTYKVLPPAGISETHIGSASGGGRIEFFDEQKGKQFSWITLILPYMEQQSLHDQFNFETTVFNQSQNPQATRIDSLLCPSDYKRGEYFEHPSFTNGKRFAKANYAAWVSPMHTDWCIRFPGALGGNGQRTAKVTDGLSNTIMLSEVRTRNHQRDQRGAWALPWTGSTILSYDIHDTRWINLHNINKGQFRIDSVLASAATQQPNTLGPNTDQLVDCPDPAGAQLDGMPCDVHTQSRYLSAAPRSGHPGGVMSVFMDSHVGFVPNNVDKLPFAYTVSIDDGEAINVADVVY